MRLGHGPPAIGGWTRGEWRAVPVKVLDL